MLFQLPLLVFPRAIIPPVPEIAPAPHQLTIYYFFLSVVTSLSGKIISASFDNRWQVVIHSTNEPAGVMHNIRNHA
jgi:hypothetical protein